MMNNKIQYQSSIKKGMIDLLMFKLYSDARTIYREYVQNALDSINSAVKEGLLFQVKDGVVNINIDNKENTITIRDNGIGINTDNAPAKLLDISASTKDGVSAAGQFGIGRLVGGGYCHKLIFKTSSQGECLATKITFDVDKIWDMVKQSKIDYLASEVIDECTEIVHIEEKSDIHYFEVRLESIKTKFASILLNKNSVIEYLNAVAPIDYKSEFKNGLVYKSIKEQPDFKVFQDELERVQIFIDNKKIEKQYGLQIDGTGDRIQTLEYFKIEDEHFGLLAWGWFALTKFSIQIGKDDKLSCIRLRKHNIQIGNKDRLTSFTEPLWREARGNSYFYGEIFATHSNLTPTADRNDLCPSEEKEALTSGLKDFFKKLTDVYTKANGAKKAIDKIKDATKKIQSNQNIDRISRDDIDNKGIAAFERLERNANYKPLKDMLLLYKTDYIEAKKEALAAINQLASIKPAIITTNPSVENPSANIYMQDSGNVTHSLETPIVQNPENDGIVGKQPLVSTTSVFEPQDNEAATVYSTLEPSTKPNSLLTIDLLTQLNGRISEDEIWILRRVFRVLNTFCPNTEHDIKIIKLLEEEIVKAFNND